MNRLLVIVAAILLISFGSGLVAVNIEGGHQYLKGSVGTVIADAAKLVEQTLPWAESINLQVQTTNNGINYLVLGENDVATLLQLAEEYAQKLAALDAQYAGATGKWKYVYTIKLAQLEAEYEAKGLMKSFAGYRHVILKGTIVGQGREAAITIDVDYSKRAASSTVVIGDVVQIDRQAYGEQTSTALVRDIAVSTQGEYNAVSSTTIWNKGVTVSGVTYTTTGDNIALLQTYAAQGPGSSQLTVISDNFINQLSSTLIGSSNPN